MLNTWNYYFKIKDTKKKILDDSTCEFLYSTCRILRCLNFQNKKIFRMK